MPIPRSCPITVCLGRGPVIKRCRLQLSQFNSCQDRVVTVGYKQARSSFTIDRLDSVVLTYQDKCKCRRAVPVWTLPCVTIRGLSRRPFVRELSRGSFRPCRTSSFLVPLFGDHSSELVPTRASIGFASVQDSEPPKEKAGRESRPFTQIDRHEGFLQLPCS